MKYSVLLTRVAVFLIAGVSTVASQTLQLENVPRLPTPVVDPASDNAQLAIKNFSVPKGLKVSLWAAEPMLANPVAIDFDEKGRLFVSETYRYRTSVLDIRDYMPMLELDLAARTIEDRLALHKKVFGEQHKEFAIESEVVRLVEDTDNDGVADKSSIYADGFNSELDGIASGVLARRGQVWFTNIPSLWLLEGDAGNVKKTELLRGFGVRYNFTGHDFHGLALGHDGKMYFSIGDRGTHVKGPDGRVVDYPDEGAVFRSNLDGTELEVVHRGLRNPQELVFDEHGNLFTGDNDSDQRDQERLVYIAEGGDSGWRVGYQHAMLPSGGPWISEGLWKPQFAQRPAYLLPPVCNIEDGPSGLTYYPGTGLTPEYRGHFFITHFKGSIARSGIQTYKLRPVGASFVPTSSQQFMGGVLPTDVTFGPDGVLYISDWVDGWPKSNKGRIYGISAANPDPTQVKLSAEVATLLKSDFTRFANQQLMTSLLSHPDRRVRLEAQFEIVRRNQPGLFSKAATGAKGVSPLGRLHAVWGLTQFARRDTKDGRVSAQHLASLLDDKDPEVRAQVAKGLGDANYKNARVALEKKLADPEPRVQFFAAQSLGKLGDEASAAPLIALLRTSDNKDPYLRHAASYALAKIRPTQELAAAAKDSSAAVRLGTVLAYRHMRARAIATLLNDADAFIVREAAEAINDAPIESALPPLAGKLSSAPVTDEALVLRAINANFRLGDAPRAQAIARYAVNDKATPAMRAEALQQLALWGKAPQRDRLVGIYRPLKERTADDAVAALTPEIAKLLDVSVPEPVQLAAIDAAAALALRTAAPALVGTVSNDKAPEAVRIAALKTLDGLGGDEVLQAVSAAEKSSVSALRLSALQIVARRAPDRATPIIKTFAASKSEVEQRAAFEAMAQLQSKQAPALLVGALDQLAAGKVAPGAQAELLEAVSKSEAPAVKARWEKQQAAWTSSGDALAPYRYALEGGNPRRGAQQFFENAVLPCARCHRAYGEGGEAGPGLDGIGAKQSAEYLLEAIVKPSAHIAKGFDNVTFTLASGETESGSVTSESASAIVIRRGDGTEAKLDPAQVKQRVAAPSSMPEIYGQVMSRNELRDLVAFLRRLDGARGAGGGAAQDTFGTSNRAMQSVPQEGAAGGHP